MKLSIIDKLSYHNCNLVINNVVLFVLLRYLSEKFLILNIAMKSKLSTYQSLRDIHSS